MRINGYELIICVLAAIFSALAHFSIRLIKKDNAPWMIIFYFTLVTIPLSLPFAISDWINPNFSEFILLIIVGLLSHFGQYFLTAAYQQEDVSKISPIYFLGVAISLFLGYTFFNETFNFLSCVGIGIIITGTFLNLKLSIKTREA